MVGSRVRSFGYTGAGTENVKRVIEAADGLIVDVRYMPYSHFRGWTRHGLIELVGPERYLHVKAFGNRNYKGGPIELENPVAGVEVIRRLLEQGPQSRTLFLMCACEEVARCHRKQVADLITYELGEPVDHLTLADFGVVKGLKGRGGGGGTRGVPNPPEQEGFEF